jgi:hypothetical protein
MLFHRASSRDASDPKLLFLLVLSTRSLVSRKLEKMTAWNGSREVVLLPEEDS